MIIIIIIIMDKPLFGTFGNVTINISNETVIIFPHRFSLNKVWKMFMTYQRLN